MRVYVDITEMRTQVGFVSAWNLYFLIKKLLENEKPETKEHFFFKDICPNGAMNAQNSLDSLPSTVVINLDSLKNHLKATNHSPRKHST